MPEENAIPEDRYADFWHLGASAEEMEELAKEKEAVLDVQLDVAAAAAEVKKHLNEHKINLVDYTRLRLELYPPHDPENLPALSMFSEKFKAMFNYADKLCALDDAPNDAQGNMLKPTVNHFPTEIFLMYESKNKEIEALVNSDAQFWEEIRAAVLPLYEPPETILSDDQKKIVAEKEAELSKSDPEKYAKRKKDRDGRNRLLQAWREQRWKKIEFFFDPVGLDCTTTIVWTNPKTGERHRGDVFRATEYPQGFVIRVI